MELIAACQKLKNELNSPDIVVAPSSITKRIFVFTRRGVKQTIPERFEGYEVIVHRGFLPK